MVTTHDLVFEVKETSTKLTVSVNFGFNTVSNFSNSIARPFEGILAQMIAGDFNDTIGKVAAMHLKNYPFIVRRSLD